MKKWLLIFISLISAKTAIAFVLFKNEDGEPLRWHLDDLNPLVHTDVVNRKTKAIKFHLSRDGWSEKNFENELNSIRSAAAQWEAVPGTVLKFEEGNLLEPGVDINGNDNQNVIYWVKEATPNGAVLVNNERTDISGALAVTFPTYFDEFFCYFQMHLGDNNVQLLCTYACKSFPMLTFPLVTSIFSCLS